LINIAKRAAEEVANAIIFLPDFFDGVLKGFGNVLNDIITVFNNGYSKDTEYELIRELSRYYIQLDIVLMH
jgi:hypothetical protein